MKDGCVNSLDGRNPFITYVLLKSLHVHFKCITILLVNYIPIKLKKKLNAVKKQVA